MSSTFTPECYLVEYGKNIRECNECDFKANCEEGTAKKYSNLMTKVLQHACNKEVYTIRGYFNSQYQLEGAIMSKIKESRITNDYIVITEEGRRITRVDLDQLVAKQIVLYVMGKRE